MEERVTRLLFVCLGNICRSPLAEGVMRHLLEARGVSDRYQVESAGTSSWHNGDPPHSGSIAIARSHHIDISSQVSMAVTAAHRDVFDLFVAMDSQNRSDLLELGIAEGKVVLLLDFAGPGTPNNVPDPYYEGGFDRVFDLVHQGCEGLLEHLES
ncbi:MAG: low molecular weight protein-tyrosine-phosphatase [Myxococcota bacterium]|nr:low molecular weight protein-tyrosine-phosphatase [Myxococcota bacterium]